MTLLEFQLLRMMGLIVLGCQSPTEPVATGGDLSVETLAKPHKHATGSIEFLRPANKGNQSTDKLTFAEFDVHEARDNQPASGNFYYRVYSLDTILHREIKVVVTEVFIDEGQNKGWFVGTVVSDTKGCGGNGQGGHDSGCSDSDGGCSGDDSGGHTDACTGHDSGHDSGCSGDDGEDHTDGCGGSSGGSGGSSNNNGNPTSGKNCRIGQILAVKIHDVDSPGMNGDGITWKWFDPDDPKVPHVEDLNLDNAGCGGSNGGSGESNDGWPHLCKKTIIGGNLVLHY